MVHRVTKENKADKVADFLEVIFYWGKEAINK